MQHHDEADLGKITMKAHLEDSFSNPLPGPNPLPNWTHCKQISKFHFLKIGFIH